MHPAPYIPWIRRVFLLLMPLLILLPAAAKAAQPELEIHKVRLRQIDATRFMRMSEYFTGEENTGKRLILRSDASRRSGTYFILTFNGPRARIREGCCFVLDIANGGPSSSQTLRFEVPERNKPPHSVFLGLTDATFTTTPVPLAWKVRLLDPEGNLVTAHSSALWHPLSERKSLQEPGPEIPISPPLPLEH
jgi:hypothetical protein